MFSWQLKQQMTTRQLMYLARNIVSGSYKCFISYYRHVLNLFLWIRKSAVWYLCSLTVILDQLHEQPTQQDSGVKCLVQRWSHDLWSLYSFCWRVTTTRQVGTAELRLQIFQHYNNSWFGLTMWIETKFKLQSLTYISLAIL